MGSGRYVNRILCYESPVENAQMDRPFPEGGYICQQCMCENYRELFPKVIELEVFRCIYCDRHYYIAEADVKDDLVCPSCKSEEKERVGSVGFPSNRIKLDIL